MTLKSFIFLIIGVSAPPLFPTPTQASAPCVTTLQELNGVKLSKTFLRAGVKYFIHKTTTQALVGILKDKILLSRKALSRRGIRISGYYVQGINRNVVYLEAIRNNPFRNRYELRNLTDEVTVFLAPRSIEKNHVLFINNGWSLGRFNSLSILSNKITVSELKNLGNNEVVFEHFKFELDEILVAVKAKDFVRLKNRLISQVSEDVDWDKVLIVAEEN